jgi:hypothetical protein
MESALGLEDLVTRACTAKLAHVDARVGTSTITNHGVIMRCAARVHDHRTPLADAREHRLRLVAVPFVRQFTEWPDR